jgi:hypothetical protein
MADFDLNELTESQKEKLTAHPEVRKMIEYEEAGILALGEALSESGVFDGEGYERENVTDTGELLIEQMESRTGRITDSTIHKVLRALVEEVDSVQ